MKTPTTRILTGFLICVLALQLASAYEVNFTSATATGTPTNSFEITQLKYEPFPVNPGEYFDFWVKAEWHGTDNPRNATFELQPTYPFSLDPNESPIRSFGVINNEPVVMKYKVRVADDAVEGTNELDLRYNSAGNDQYWVTKQFDVQVANARTDFDLVVQDSTASDVSIALANIGKNTANSLIVRIPQQNGYSITGTNGQMVGNLDSGDYTIVSFGVQPTGRAAGPLQVQLDYTDNIGVRRSVMKNVSLISSSPIAGNFSGQRRAVSGASGGTFNKTTTSTTSSTFSKPTFWIIVILIAAVVYLGYYNRDRLFSRRQTTTRSGKSEPDWVSSERSKK